MKHNISNLLPALLLWVSLGAGVISCNPPEPDQPTTPVTLTATPSSLTFTSDGSQSLSVSISTGSDVSWSVSSSASWLSLSPSSGTGPASVSVSAYRNTGEARTATVKFTSHDGTATASVEISQDKVQEAVTEDIVPAADAFDGTKRAGTTYQLLVYSFADSDGDGIGDFNGITSRLDYLDALGVTALWLSPIHPAMSYHGYDVTDYTTVNPLYGTEADFKNLVDKAKAKGIDIYLDYVLNHSGKDHPWFKDAVSNASSPYRSYYFLSANPASEYSSFPMLAGTTYSSGEWKPVTGGAPTLTITKTEEAAATGSASWNLWLWEKGKDGKALSFIDDGDGTCHLTVELNGSFGMLVRRYPNWDTGSKFGASTLTTPTPGEPFPLTADGADIDFTGTGRYRITLSGVSGLESLYYMGAFSDWMPDLNYGDISAAGTSGAFQDLAASADKWIKLGVAGFRLDAVKHICGGLNSWNDDANISFLQKWYDHCNATYHAEGHTDDIFMVGEMWDNSHQYEKRYYQGLTSCFEFGFWPLLQKALTSGSASDFATRTASFISDHKTVRQDAQTSFFLTNHDHSSVTGDGEVRAADDLGKDAAKEKQAAAILLTVGGKPFVYQGEELGYWGNSKGKGDEYIRTPILWDKAGTQVARKGVNDKVDNSMLTASISVEAQEADSGSLLHVYRSFARLRNTYPALASGTMSATGINSSTVASWYMTSADGQKMLILHNLGSSAATLTLTDDLSKPVALLGSASKKGSTLTIQGHSSVVFAL